MNKVRISPAASVYAKTNNIEITGIIGSGRNGTITLQDVKDAMTTSVALSNAPVKKLSPQEVADLTGQPVGTKGPCPTCGAPSLRLGLFAQHCSAIRDLSYQYCMQYAAEHGITTPEQAMNSSVVWLREAATVWCKANPVA